MDTEFHYASGFAAKISSNPFLIPSSVYQKKQETPSFKEQKEMQVVNFHLQISFKKVSAQCTVYQPNIAILRTPAAPDCVHCTLPHLPLLPWFTNAAALSKM